MTEYEVDPFAPPKLYTGEIYLNGSKGEELATFGAGCYWGTEKFFSKNFQKQFPKSILGHSVGFMSPNKDAIANPKYK